MNLENIYHEIKGGRVLTESELAHLRGVIVARTISPYELSQAVLSYCLLCPPDSVVADSIAVSAMDYVRSEDEWSVTCTEWLVLALTTDWHLGVKLEPVCREVIARWKDESYDSLFRQCSVVLGEIAAKRRDSELLEQLRCIGLAATEEGNTSIAEKAAVGCRVATEGAVPVSQQTPDDVPAYLRNARFP